MAFWELASERQIGMAVGAIPRSAISRYAEEFDIVGDDLDMFHRILRGLDAEYLLLVNKRPEDKPLSTSASADDIEGVKAVFGRLEARGGRRKALPKPKTTNGNQH